MYYQFLFSQTTHISCLLSFSFIKSDGINLFLYHRFEGTPTGDIQAILGKPATRFGDFVRDNLKPVLA